jgi:hypothetical protein
VKHSISTDGVHYKINNKSLKRFKQNRINFTKINNLKLNISNHA